MLGNQKGIQIKQLEDNKKKHPELVKRKDIYFSKIMLD